MKTFKEYLKEAENNKDNKKNINEEVRTISSSKVLKDVNNICKKYSKALEVLKNA